MEPPGDTVVETGYLGAIKRYCSDTRVRWNHQEIFQCGAIMRHFSDAREPTGDKVRYSYLLFLVAYVNLVTISKSTDS